MALHRTQYQYLRALGIPAHFCSRDAIAGFKSFSSATHFPASKFHAVIMRERTATERAYDGKPLAALSQKLRAEVIAGHVDSTLHPSAQIKDAVASTCIDGRRRGVNMTSYDWLRDDSRVECKSSKFLWSDADKRWQFQMCNIKLSENGLDLEAAFDDLLLAFYTPRGIYIYRHGVAWGPHARLPPGFCSTGKSTAIRGYKLFYYGKRSQEHWETALREVLRRLDDAEYCWALAFVPLHDIRVAEALAANSLSLAVYNGVPLASVQPTVRGLQLALASM